MARATSEQRRHRDHQRGADDALVGVRLVAQPGVAAPGPPQEREQHQAAQRAAPAEVVAMKAVTWVMAKTKTRSKNSSSGVTVWSGVVGSTRPAGRAADARRRSPAALYRGPLHDYILKVSVRIGARRGQ